ncbi:hypothetical protein TrVE_jg8441 [Triparma verrucosa]|uniref:CEP76 C2 domain-containing protein n=1 Tax=Triparma verrucosa TaxID=1606542 RepID=A0A9W7F2H9_9STRA|nr:hypothetical protein TrVE_jg8441 [Triparma verrucosa]
MENNPAVANAKPAPAGADVLSVRDALRSTPAYSALRENLVEMLQGDAPASSAGVTAMLKSLLQNSQTNTTPGPKVELDPDMLYLRVTVGRGAAFISHLSPSNAPHQSSALTDLSLSLTFKGTRVTTSPVRSSMDPSFSGSFVFPLAASTPSDSQAWHNLITSTADKLHIACTSSPVTSKATHKSFAMIQKDLVATGSVDWRTSLISPEGGMIELKGSGGEGGFLVGGGGGTVFMKLELVQSQSDLTLPLTTDEIMRHITLNDQKELENARDFYLYARDWWRSFQEISNEHAIREGVRIFAEDEQGTNRCVCTYVSPVKSGRLIDSPRHAARFVSLIPFERRSGVGGRRVDSWQSWHGFLSRGRGDVEDHACLLCSLLLGFGLSAYVVIGQAYDSSDGGDEQREHAWVCTITQGIDVTMIESLTGQRYEIAGGKAGPEDAANLPYATVSCVFNNTGFWANKNVDDGIAEVNWDLDNIKNWKTMDGEAIRVAPKTISNPATLIPCSSSTEVAEGLEKELQELIKSKREAAYGLSSQWDPELAYLLQPAIAAYENERLTGYSFGSDDFQNAVKNAVPERHCFKGLPLCFAHLDAGKIMAGIEGSDIGADILKSQGDAVKFALRVRVYGYAENTLAVWVMLAVKFLPKGE